MGAGCWCRSKTEEESACSYCGESRNGLNLLQWKKALELSLLSICSLNSICCCPLFCSQIAFTSDPRFCLAKLNRLNCSFSGYFSGTRQFYPSAPCEDSLTLGLMCSNDPYSASEEVLNWLKQPHAFLSALQGILPPPCCQHSCLQSCLAKHTLKHFFLSQVVS